MNDEGKTQNLKRQSVLATLWSAADEFAKQGSQFIVTVLLARILAPEDFGTVALLTLFVGMAEVVVNSGLHASLIQKKNITRKDTSSVFYFNVTTAMVMASLMAMASGWFAEFFNVSLLRPLTYVLAANLFISALGTIHRSLFVKNLNFRIQMKINIIAILTSGVCAIWMASEGWGVWSLAMRTLLTTVITVALLWCWSPWRPGLVFSLESLRELYNFGMFIFLTAMLDNLFRHANTLFIGKLYSTRDLGFYLRGDNVQQMASGPLSRVVGRVAFPIFSQINHDKMKLKLGVRKALTGLVMINTPVMLGLLVCAHPLIVTIFGEKWEPATPYLQVLCLSGIFWPMHVVNTKALMAQGHSKLLFWQSVMKKLIGLASLVIASTFGVLAIAWNMVFVEVLGYFFISFYTGVHLNYPSRTQLMDVSPYFIASLIMMACIWPLKTLHNIPNAGILFAQVMSGAIIYVAICWAMKLNAFIDMLGYAKSIRNV